LLSGGFFFHLVNARRPTRGCQHRADIVKLVRARKQADVWRAWVEGSNKDEGRRMKDEGNDCSCASVKRRLGHLDGFGASQKRRYNLLFLSFVSTAFA